MRESSDYLIGGEPGATPASDGGGGEIDLSPVTNAISMQTLFDHPAICFFQTVVSAGTWADTEGDIYSVDPYIGNGVDTPDDATYAYTSADDDVLWFNAITEPWDGAMGAGRAFIRLRTYRAAGTGFFKVEFKEDGTLLGSTQYLYPTQSAVWEAIEAELDIDWSGVDWSLLGVEITSRFASGNQLRIAEAELKFMV